jgi:uncharacterized protein YpmS
MRVAIYIENDRLDLFDDENIEIVSSITDSSDVTKNTTDYSKGFTVPANDRNNAIFKHYYNATIDNTFDARVKKDGRIELDGLPFKSGKIRLDKVNVKSGKASSYSINFFGKLVNLKDALKDDELTSLDLSALNFNLTQLNMITGLGSGLFEGKIITNLLSKKRFYYNTDPTDNTNTETTVNIANVGLNPLELRPSLKLIEIIKAIEVKYNFVFSRDFFGRTEFDNLYMWLNNNATIQGQPTEQLINWTSGNGADFGLSLTTDTWVNNTFYNSASDNKRFLYRVSIETTNPEPYKVIVKNNGVIVAELQSQGGDFVSEFIEIKTIPNTNFSYQFFVASNNSMTYEASILLRQKIGLIITSDKQSFASSNSFTSVFQVSANLPKMKIIDFLKSIFNLFKLVIIQENNTDIYVNTLVDYYSQGRLWDVTKYIDFESYEVNRGDILNEIDFSFTEPTTLLNNQFKLNTGLGYGDEELKLADENGDLLDGKKLEVKPQFEQLVYERLRDIETGENTNIMYGLSADEQLEPQNPKGHIFYNNKENVTETPFKVQINDSGDEGDYIGLLNIPSHTLGFDTPQYSTIFSEEFNEWDGSLISNTLYTNYYKDYIDSIFNIKRRDFSFKSILPLHILLAMRLNDVLKIKDDYYRIDKYTSNITTKNVQLNLINSFDNTINPFATDSTIFFRSATDLTQTIFVKGNDSFTVTLVGSPTWATYSISDRLITIEMEVNNTGLLRGVTVEITNGTKTLTVEVIQNPDTVRADNNIITADSTLITADNG